MALKRHRIERRLLSEIRPAEYNPRVTLSPGDRAYDALEASMSRFGVVEPLVWNERTGRLVGGHQRLGVMLAAGEIEADVVVVDLSEADEKALNVALNKIDGAWDDGKLAEVLDELLDRDELDIELTGFGFDEAEDLIDRVLGGPAQERTEDFDPGAELERGCEPVTRPGELIQLGPDPATAHRLLCGDCTDHRLVTRLIGGERAGLMATDPPYGVGIDDRWDEPDSAAALYEPAFQEAVRTALRPNAAIYIWHASRTQALLERALNAAGIRVHCQIIWVKPAPAMGRSVYLWRHEPCFMGWQAGKRPKRAGGEKLTTVWELPAPKGSSRPDHPTPKPVEEFEIPMRQHTGAGDVCYEPFAGSGTQFIAAERMGRRCFGLELSPRYCDLIVRRFIAFAGAAAVPCEVAERYAVHPAGPKGGR